MGLNYAHFKEAGSMLPYSQNHHSNDIKVITQVISTNNSLIVLGLSGTGKSSVLRFLASNPHSYHNNMQFIYVDCNQYSKIKNEITLEKEILSQIVNDFLVSQSNPWPDEFAADQTLRSFMKVFTESQNKDHLVIIFDRVEGILHTLNHTFFDYLRSLRDSNPSLSYIFSGRSLSSEDFGNELADIFWHESHWIGALSLEDAEWTVHRHLVRLKLEQLGAEARNKLIRCVGGHPQLLKYGCELMQSGYIDINSNESEIIERLVASSNIRRQCEDLWQDLNHEAQNVLRDMFLVKTSVTLSPTVEWLIRCGILTRIKGNEINFVSPVFQEYVRTMGAPDLALENSVVYKGSQALALSREEFELFKVLWNKRGEVVSQDQISERVWPEANGEVTPQMITTLVKRLRKKLGDNDYIINVRGRGYYLSD
ncbi:MAG: winged helix-turn-helix domain-containing protein [Anaerolineae bacterium]|nr:winged helix-turn-helix domain-containing protein [Anaerolineae bacterium]